MRSQGSQGSGARDVVWSGQWVADRLGVRLEGGEAWPGLPVPAERPGSAERSELPGPAERRGPAERSGLPERQERPEQHGLPERPGPEEPHEPQEPQEPQEPHEPHKPHKPHEPLERPGLHDLLGLALRRNPKRAHLLVSNVLGKHVPQRPATVHGAGVALGRRVRELLGEDAAARAVVLGYAETATGLGHSVADGLALAPYLHSTRRPVAGVASVGGFEEEHSHATSHLLLPEDPGLLGGDGPLVLVDDEFSTGKTVLNTIAALHRRFPRDHYVVVALVDMRSPQDRTQLDAFAADLGARVDLIAAAAGTVRLPEGVLERGQRLVAEHEVEPTDAGAGPVTEAGPSAARSGTAALRIDLAWPEGLPDGGRHGFTPAHRAHLEAALPDMATRIAEALSTPPHPAVRPAAPSDDEPQPGETRTDGPAPTPAHPATPAGGGPQAGREASGGLCAREGQLGGPESDAAVPGEDRADAPQAAPGRPGTYPDALAAPAGGGPRSGETRPDGPAPASDHSAASSGGRPDGPAPASDHSAASSGGPATPAGGEPQARREASGGRRGSEELLGGLASTPPHPAASPVGPSSGGQGGGATAAPAAPRHRVLVLGFEELMYAPLRIAEALDDALDGVEVRYSTTTRSPVLAVDDPGYAIRTRLTFPAHDDPADGPGPRYAYNVAPGSDPTRRFDAVVAVVDSTADTPALHAPDGLLARLAAQTDRLLLAVVPSYVPQPPPTPRPVPERQAPPMHQPSHEPLRGPDFSSYAPDEVGWLLQDFSQVTLEAPTEEREEAIQSGGAHYAESLPVEYQPSARYQELFRAALDTSAARIARAVGAVTETVLAERSPRPVLVSLARAGTPVGVLMRRWAQHAHGLDLPHYAISIVRGRGIDTAALRWLADHHDPADLVFVDGWTGKGAITRELADAVAPYPDIDPRIAVLADPGRCVETYGTRDDFLVPSACLNSTVSGLISRTVLRADLVGPNDFHGAKYYRELADADVSAHFLDTVAACFDEVADAVVADATELAATDRTPTWEGWAAVERISQEYGIHDVNLVKPGVGETTRVLLRRVPWKILAQRGAGADLDHVRLLAEQRGVPVEETDGLPYTCVGLIHPRYTRGATGADGKAVGKTVDSTVNGTVNGPANGPANEKAVAAR
ncbi:phosphoribosyltransferase domain-containing protein [Streptomyces sp. NPDC005355]|uniref:phosphoribosyltransferase domain-containing protein n=1 Tax=Streptomyces sp. NPDC005355 TaxID=3157038 RepID=UPI0033AA515A